MNCCTEYGQCEHGPGCPTGAVTLPPVHIVPLVKV